MLLIYLFPHFFTHSHDCGFHMLMNAKYWDGRIVPLLQEKDIMNIRKMSTHKWLSYDENDTDWEDILNLAQVRGFSHSRNHFSTKHQAILHKKCSCLFSIIQRYSCVFIFSVAFHYKAKRKLTQNLAACSQLFLFVSIGII